MGKRDYAILLAAMAIGAALALLEGCSQPACAEGYGCLEYDKQMARSVMSECVSLANGERDYRVRECMASAIELSCTRYGFAHEYTYGIEFLNPIRYTERGIQIGLHGSGAEGKCPATGEHHED